MSDLFKKLNTLIQAGMHDVLDEAQKVASTPGKLIPRRQLGADIDHEVGQLRQQINKALDYEDEIVAKIAEVQSEVNALDEQSNQALANDDEVNARYYLERMYRAQQRQSMLESDLNEHRIVTQELMQRVNELDATIAEVRHREQAAAQQDTPADELSSASADTAAKTGVEIAQEISQQASKALSDVLREARERVEQMTDLTEAQADVQQQVTSSVEEQVQQETQKAKIDEDIAARRARLSAPPKKPTDGNSA